MKAKAIRIHAPGGPEALCYEEVEVDQPGPGEALIRQTAIGVNFIDVYQRSGLYPLGGLPAVIGMEGAGQVEAIGEGVDEVAVGDRVAYADNPPGAYAEARLMPAHRLVRLPEGIAEEQAAAMMLKGMTVQYLTHRTYRIEPGDWVLLHAAAGGVGLIACQWLKHLGARCIGTVGSAEKAMLAEAHGCDHTINYRQEDVAARVAEITGGRGVDVVYDSVGKDTFMGSLDSLKPRGLMVTFGNASGPVDPISPLLLAQKGCLFLTRPSLMAYNADRAELVQAAQDLFKVVESGAVKVAPAARYALKETAQAHADLEARKTTGSTILIP